MGFRINPPHLQWKTVILIDVHIWVKRIGLKDHGDIPIFWLQVVYHFAINQNFAFRSIFQPGNHAHCRRLTTARGAEQNQKFFIGDGQIKVVHTNEAAPSFRKVLQLNFSHCSIHSRSQNHFANVFKLH